MENQAFNKMTKHKDNYFTFPQSIAHIAPGIFTLIAFIAFKPLVNIWNYPPLMAFTLAVLVVNLPLLLSIMFYQGKKRNGKYSLLGVVSYREPLPWTKFLWMLLLGIALAAALFPLGAFVDTFTSMKVFGWLPAWMFMDNQAQYAVYDRSVLVITVVCWTVITGLILPVVEEMYFRGYLLPRMVGNNALLGVAGNALLFTLYHAWQPFNWPSVFLLGLLFAGFAFWSRDIKLSAALHVIGNLQFRFLVLFALL